MSHLGRLDHRPYNLPEHPWIMGMSWHDLLFLHWPIAPDLLRPLIPARLEIDTFDGTGWIGVVPFRMSRVRPRGVPSLPWFSAFLELNVRTYVKADGRSGVWFFSLDAANPVAVRLARWTYHLPYFDARMTLQRAADSVDYSSVRTHRGAAKAEFSGVYRPVSPVFQAAQGSFDHWLTERYCLYAAKNENRVYRGEIHHEPWPLQRADVEIRRNTMTNWLGFQVPEVPPVAHYAHRLDVVAWWPQLI